LRIRRERMGFAIGQPLVAARDVFSCCVICCVKPQLSCANGGMIDGLRELLTRSVQCPQIPPNSVSSPGVGYPNFRQIAGG
jgi:hypothetical protein